MDSPEEEYLSWAPKRRIPLPSESTDEYMLVRIYDFHRLRRSIEELSPPHENIPAAYFALFGAALAIGVAIPPLLTASNLPSWVVPTFIVSAGAFFVLGLILTIVARTLRKGRKEDAKEIAQEMRVIEESYRGKKSANPNA
jgi:protein-S-isoprenylcysteine O-methyltransferase Ste14